MTSQETWNLTHTNTHHIHFAIMHTTCFSNVWKRWTVLLATPLHLVHVQAVQIILPHVTAATAKHKNLQHTKSSVPCYIIITVSTCVTQTETSHFKMNALQSHFIQSTSSQYESHLSIYPARSLAAVMLQWLLLPHSLTWRLIHLGGHSHTHHTHTNTHTPQTHTHNTHHIHPTYTHPNTPYTHTPRPPPHTHTV